MYSRILGLTTSALILAYGTVGAVAQSQMTPEPDQQQMPARHGTMGHGSMTCGSMMGPPFMMRMMFALVDSDGDGTIELPEFLAAHERIFKAMDSNKDGKLTLEEMQAFIRGTK
jgi:EF hand